MMKTTRRPYTTADFRYIRAHHKDKTAAELAHDLGRTTGILKRFIQARPELHKRILQCSLNALTRAENLKKRTHME